MSRERLHITIRGAVQGVGFRPFVHRLAREMEVGGWVRNDGPSVVLEAEGAQLTEFVARLSSEEPEGARIDAVDVVRVPPRGERSLEIVPSRSRAAPPSVVPDRVTCDACLADVLDPESRFYQYPFTNCSRCGPRYSIVDRLPYDRRNTAMARFAMCADCRDEYSDPRDRRFHAQPTACPACGPRLTARARDGRALHEGAAALEHAVRRLTSGEIVALKGLGGYQLLADATDSGAVERLRARKHRPHKPFAVLVADLASARALCEVSAAEAELLRSPAGPIVLVESRGGVLAGAVHPHHVETGILLPTTPLHHLLARRTGRPLICTSGNAGEEPICTDDGEALERLGTIADAFLTHDRPIRRAVDDSVARVVAGAPQVLRVGRGYAPLVLPGRGGEPALAAGAHQKNALAVGDGRRIVVGTHVGDLTNTLSIDAMRRQAGELCRFFAVAPARVACDQHPDYASAAFAREQDLPVTEVQHHAAHAFAVLLEHGHAGPALAVVWDGTGLGTDGTIWGGELLRMDPAAEGPGWERFAHLRPFRLPGGDAAARHPERALAGLLDEVPELRERVPARFRALLDARLGSPRCTSAGRLFDGVAALLGHDGEQTYEGMAPALLERDARRAPAGAVAVAPLTLRSGRPLTLDWSQTLLSIARERRKGAGRAELAAAFHRALAAAIVDVAFAAGEPTVLLTGGCFQNRVLAEEASRRLERAGFAVLHARRLPPNDGCIAAGQLAASHGARHHVPRHSRPH